MTSLLLAALTAPEREGTFWLPEAASETAQYVDGPFYFIYWLCVIFFIATIGVMTYFAIKYKRKSDADRTSPLEGSMRLEFLWSAIPSVLLVMIFFWGFDGFMKMAVPPANAWDIRVMGQKWSWSFTYPREGVTSTELVVPVNQPIRLAMTSQDVLHSFFIPAFRVKRDVVPNRYTVIWFNATVPGEYPVTCTEYCGRSHSEMRTVVRVVSLEEYHEWLNSIGGLPDGMSYAEWGEQLYTQQQCNTCHSLDGTNVVGPSFQGLYGREEQLTTGETVEVDDNYLRESIVEPNAKIVQGYPPAMPTYQGRLTEEQMTGLIEFIKSQSE